MHSKLQAFQLQCLYLGTRHGLHLLVEEGIIVVGKTLLHHFLIYFLNLLLLAQSSLEGLQVGLYHGLSLSGEYGAYGIT